MTCVHPIVRVARVAVASVVVSAIGMTTLLGIAPAGASAHVASSDVTAGAVRQVAVVAPGWRKDMLARINAVRAAAGVTPLKPCPALRRSAQDYAMVMSSRDHYGHIGPDGSEPGERMLREGYRWRVIAENIAAGQRTIVEVVEAWVDSPGHYANLVNPAYRHVGLGHGSSEGSEYGDYWVQNFGRGRGC